MATRQEKKQFKFDSSVQKTEDYSIFNRLNGNRSVLPARVNKIVRSIKSIGQVPAPIIVNEKYEVVDGQGRLEAFKQINLPVYYMVVEGLGFNECIAMNIDQANWKLADYISSHSEQGNTNYILLSELLNRYKAYGIDLRPIIRAITNGYEVDNKIIKNGEFVCTQEDYNNAVEILNYAARFHDLIREIGGGKKTYLYSAICFAFMCDKCDNERLYKKMSENIREFRRCSSIKDCLEELSGMYNHRIKVESKLYLNIEYEKWQAARYPWYKSRYGKAIS